MSASERRVAFVTGSTSGIGLGIAHRRSPESKRKNDTPPCGHFHKHWTTNVTFSVITRKTGPPPGSHVFQQTRTIFTLI
ncbi:hypothetical protein DPMN_143671 [Dreissena polymorpha]|uniref:Uncharacterized protein n=1 Tax=Dreissena polymorpha TaxID=45954 RepID=A0A9D4JK87_DREPO|nr:hypothetical protein DPMN_143671 [Dreissena polymorpha]